MTKSFWLKKKHTVFALGMFKKIFLGQKSYDKSTLIFRQIFLSVQGTLVSKPILRVLRLRDAVIFFRVFNGIFFIISGFVNNIAVIGALRCLSYICELLAAINYSLIYCKGLKISIIYIKILFFNQIF